MRALRIREKKFMTLMWLICNIRMKCSYNQTSIGNMTREEIASLQKNPLGAVETYQYDNLNRMIRAKLSDGNDI